MDVPAHEITPTLVSTTPFRLVIGLDWDHTVFGGHMHQILAESGETDPKKQWLLVKDIKPLGEDGEWTKALQLLLSKGHYIPIVTRGAFPHIIVRYIAQVLGINPQSEAKTQIKVISANIPYKNQHLVEALKQFNLPPDFPVKSVILVDDDRENIYKALAEGYRTILAATDGKHIRKLVKLVAKLENEHAAKQKTPTEDFSGLLPHSAGEFHASCRRRSPSPEFPKREGPPEREHFPVSPLRNNKHL